VSTKIRLKRIGRKKKPFYRIVIADSRASRDGRFVESIGYYDPLTEPVNLKIDEDKAITWLKNGAIPSDTVKNLFTIKGINLRFDLMKKGFPEDKISEEYKKHQLLQEEKLKRKALLRDINKKVSKAHEKQETKEEKPPEVQTEEKKEEKPEKKQEIKIEEKEEAKAEKPANTIKEEKKSKTEEKQETKVEEPKKAKAEKPEDTKKEIPEDNSNKE